MNLIGEQNNKTCTTKDLIKEIKEIEILESVIKAWDTLRQYSRLDAAGCSLESEVQFVAEMKRQEKVDSQNLLLRKDRLSVMVSNYTGQEATIKKLSTIIEEAQETQDQILYDYEPDPRLVGNDYQKNKKLANEFLVFVAKLKEEISGSAVAHALHPPAKKEKNNGL